MGTVIIFTFSSSASSTDYVKHLPENSPDREASESEFPAASHHVLCVCVCVLCVYTQMCVI